MLSYRETRAVAMRQYFMKLYSECDGNISEAARVAGLTRWEVYRKMRQFAPELLDGHARRPVAEAVVARASLQRRDRPRKALGGNDAWKALDEAGAR